MWDFFKVRQIRARKDHRCDQCGGAIPTGTSHFYAAGRFDGDFMTYREHDICRAAWVALWERRGGMVDGTAPFLRDDDWEAEERTWFARTYPAVAAQLRWNAPQHDGLSQGVQRVLLVDCYRAGQISEDRWQRHLAEDDPALMDVWREVAR